jgi:hypothetical protein
MNNDDDILNDCTTDQDNNFWIDVAVVFSAAMALGFVAITVMRLI